MQDGQNQNEPGWVFKSGDDSSQATVPQESSSPETNPYQEGAAGQENPLSGPDHAAPGELPHISWTASEYVANPKSAGWFGMLALGAAALSVVVYLLTKDIISVVVIGMVSVITGVFAARQPRVLEYALDNHGLYIGDKLYPYGAFKSFSIGEEHALSYISLMPLRRFMPPITLHYDPNDEDKIADTLAAYLPFEEHKQDMVDSISRRFRL